MSRNTKIRNTFENLPPFPKLKDGKVQCDPNGNIIYVNHFRQIRAIEREMWLKGHGRKSRQTLAAINRYSMLVLEYHRLKHPRKSYFKHIVWALIFLLVVWVGYDVLIGKNALKYLINIWNNSFPSDAPF